MSTDLFAGVAVVDRARAVDWYQRLLRSEPEFFPNDREAVFGLAEHRYVYVEERADRAGRGLLTVFVDDLDEWTAAVRDRGLEPDEVETYDNGVRKLIFHDPDGNEIGVAGAISR